VAKEKFRVLRYILLFSFVLLLFFSYEGQKATGNIRKSMKTHYRDKCDIERNFYHSGSLYKIPSSSDIC
jgi:hypothetical protein